MRHQANREMLKRELAAARRPLDEWRRREGRLNPIPEAIWDRAVGLAARHGV